MIIVGPQIVEWVGILNEVSLRIWDHIFYGYHFMTSRLFSRSCSQSDTANIQEPDSLSPKISLFKSHRLLQFFLFFPNSAA
jgi:hypothetical protein